jgi:hypothetical protein
MSNPVLSKVEKLLKLYRKQLTQAANTIKEQAVSNYPIFVASQLPLELGIPLLLKEQMIEGWSINASTLEEFHAKQIIDAEKVDNFRALYLSHKDELCIFAMTEVGAKFIFIPSFK